MKKVKKLLVKFAKKFGYDVVKIKPQKKLNDGYASPYESSLLTLLSNNNELNIVVVGANDGLVGDPVYHFANMFPKRTQLLLVEPQQELIPFLKENYSFHPSYKVYKGAVGPEKELKLYSVDKSAWNYVAKIREKDWPEHRASTGRTSPDKQVLKRWLEKIVNDDRDVDGMISEDVVPCMKLAEVLDETDFPRNIDVLQVDTEGFDDQVIYNSDIDELKPNLIFFEISLLSEQKLESIQTYLEDRGYFVANLGVDALAIKNA